MMTKLTKAEFKIKKLAIFGLSNRQISERLKIKESTVKFHLTSIYRKSGVKNRANLIVISSLEYNESNLNKKRMDREIKISEFKLNLKLNKEKNIIELSKKNRYMEFPLNCNFIIHTTDRDSEVIVLHKYNNVYIFNNVRQVSVFLKKNYLSTEKALKTGNIEGYKVEIIRRSVNEKKA